MSSRIIPADHAGRDQSSRKSERSLSQLPVRLQSTVNETILQLGVSLRLLSQATKTFQGELEGLLDKCKDISNATLENLLKTEFNMNELWQKVFARKWRPTRKNKRVLCENILQNCMIYLRSEYIGRPNRENILKTFGSLIALDLLEFAPVVNVIVFFYMGEVTAGWILLGCIIFERLLQVLKSMAIESLSLSSVLGSLFGVKTFLTSYKIACDGIRGRVEGSNVYVFSYRLIQKGLNGIFALTPQAILNAYMWWDNPLYESDGWKDIHLIGDEGANYASMVHTFLSTDLPWDKLVPWLEDNKNTFKSNPPTWLSKEWLTLIPKQYRDQVWDDDEYEELCVRIEGVEQEFIAREFQPLVDDEEVNDDETLEDIHQEKEKLPKNDNEGVIEEKNDDIPRTETNTNNHTDEVNENENRNNSPTGESTSSEEETV
eukprot:g3733.t1